MSSKSRKFIWSVPVVAAFAVIGALAAFGVLGVGNAQAQDAAPPTNVEAEAGNALINIYWTASSAPGLDGYEVQIKESSEPEADWGAPTTFDPDPITGTDTSVSITGLALDTSFDVRIRATTARSGANANSDWVTVTGLTPTAPKKPGVVQNLEVSLGSGNTELAVSWDAPDSDGGSDITSYVVSVVPDTSSITCDPGTAASSTPYTCTLSGTDLGTATVIGGLTASTEYTITVTADNVVATGSTTASDEATGTPATPPSSGTLASSSSTGSATVSLTLTVTLTEDLTGSDWVEIYLEDDYQEPGSIANSAVVFEVRGDPTDSAATQLADTDTTFVAAAVEIDDGGDLNGEDNAVVISARIPDMKGGDLLGYPKAGQTLILLVSEAAGVKNPSEENDHDNGFSIIGGTDPRAGDAEMENVGDPESYADDDGKLLTWAKISLSDEDNGRGTPITITGSGFNDGTVAEAFVFEGVEGTTPECDEVLGGTSLGTADVGSDDKFTIAFTVHQDDFAPGAVNYICAADNDSPNRQASAVKTFELQDSLTIDPMSVNSGDEVTLKPRDYVGDVVSVELAGEKMWTAASGDVDDFAVTPDGSDYLFDMPGGLSGIVPVKVNFSTGNATGTITVTPSGLELSKTEVAPNETIIISGSGFSENSTILVSEIKIDGKALVVDNAGTRGTGDARNIQTTSSGEFTATVSVWHDGSGNPALDDDTYTVKATDANGFEGSVSITVLEPSLSVNPTVASPRDYITISGANWPISTSDVDNEVSINVDDRDRSASVDSTGRFNYSYQLSGSIDIGTSHTITVTYDGGDGGDIEEEIDFEVPESNVVLTPSQARPGETIGLEITGMPIYSLVKHIKIDGADRLDISFNTDAEGDVTVTGILVPFLDPGFYPVEVGVGTNPDNDELAAETAVVQLEILAEDTVTGTAQSVSDALSEISGSLVRVFHFNNASKVWTFYDPRPEFEGLNTLNELANGQPYWILVSEGQENVVLNGQTRNLTCVGGDCWNQEVW